MISEAMTYPSDGKEASLWNTQDGYAARFNRPVSSQYNRLISVEVSTMTPLAGEVHGRSSCPSGLLLV